MSDYPRPALSVPTLARSYPPDRIVALLYATLVLYSSGRSVLWALRHPASALRAETWAIYLTIEGLGLAFEAFVLWGVARSRWWGFVALLVLVGIVIAGAAVTNRVSVSNAVEVAVALYALARLGSLMGPRPIRSRGLRP